MKIILFDLEATCWQGYQVGRSREIIEIGAVKLDGYGNWIDTFETLVRPIDHPHLSTFCTELTGITTEMVRRAPKFPQAISAFLDWADPWSEHIVWASWGQFDEELMRNNLYAWKMDDEWLSPYIDLKRQYQQLRALPKAKGLISALRKEGMEFIGRQHRGLDDAKNLARLFVCYIDMWQY